MVMYPYAGLVTYARSPISVADPLNPDARTRREKRVTTGYQFLPWPADGSGDVSYRVLPQEQKERVYEYERGESLSSGDVLHSKGTAYAYNATGEARTVKHLVRLTVTERGSGPARLSNTTIYTYLPDDEQRWLLGRLTRKYEIGKDGKSKILRTRTRTHDYVYHPTTGRRTAEVRAPGRLDELTRHYVHDARGNVTRIWEEDYRSKRNRNGGKKRDFETTYYDDEGLFPIMSLNGMEHRTRYLRHPGLGVLLAREEPDGNLTTWSYDAFGRMLSFVHPDGTGETVTYSADQEHPFVVRTQHRTGAISIAKHDRLGRVVETQQSRLRLVEPTKMALQRQSYGPHGLVQTRTVWFMEGEQPEGQWSYRYDNLDRIAETTAPDGSQTRTEYDGLLTKHWDARGDLTRTYQDVRGNIIRIAKFDYVNRTYMNTLYTYEAFGNLTHIFDPHRNQTIIRHDRRGRRKVLEDPDMGIIRYNLDAFGNTLSIVREATNATTHFTHDAIGRVLERRDPDGEVAQWNYDGGWRELDDGSIEYVGPDVGRLLLQGNSSTTTQYDYDSYGRSAGSSSAYTENPSLVYSVETFYDEKGRVKAIIYPDPDEDAAGELAIRRVYDALGNLRQIYRETEFVREGEGEIRFLGKGELLWRLEEVDAAGRILRESFGNGTHTEREYEQVFGKVTRVSTGHINGANGGLQDLAYRYDRNGNLIRRQLGPALVEEFSYDGLNRLIGSRLGDGKQIRQTDTYGYDSLGNIVVKEGYSLSYGNGAGPHAVTSMQPSLGVLNDGVGQRFFDYDGNGNLVTVRNSQDHIIRSVEYTSLDKPAEIDDGDTWMRLAYDANGSRVYRELESITPNGRTRQETYYLGDLYERTYDHLRMQPVSHRFYVMGPERPIAVVERGLEQEERTRYLHPDHLGSVHKVTDEAGNTVETLSFAAFGERREPDGLPAVKPIQSTVNRGFTGHEHDDALGLINMKGRLYDPLLGRFLTPDRFVQFPYSSEGLNRYSYVQNNPLTHTDPTGHFISKLGKAIYAGGKALGRGVKWAYNKGKAGAKNLYRMGKAAYDWVDEKLESWNVQISCGPAGCSASGGANFNVDGVTISLGATAYYTPDGIALTPSAGASGFVAGVSTTARVSYELHPARMNTAVPGGGHGLRARPSLADGIRGNSAQINAGGQRPFFQTFLDFWGGSLSYEEVEQSSRAHTHLKQEMAKDEVLARAVEDYGRELLASDRAVREEWLKAISSGQSSFGISAGYTIPIIPGALEYTGLVSLDSKSGFSFTSLVTLKAGNFILNGYVRTAY